MAENKRILGTMFAKIKEALRTLSEVELRELMLRDRENLEERGYTPHFMIDCSWSKRYLGIPHTNE